MSTQDLIAMAAALGAGGSGGPLSAAERRLLNDTHLHPPTPEAINSARNAILIGSDPLGEAFYALRDAATRRAVGAIYTPEPIVTPMVQWVMDQQPARIVDAGSGSGRYTAEVLRRDPNAVVVSIDLDPVATLMTRAVVSVLGGTKTRVRNMDFTRLTLPAIKGTTAFIGNPPYLRHHQVPTATKVWAQETARTLGHKISGLAGLHAFFYLAVAKVGKAGDVGCFVTSAEWLDVNYGSIIRNLLTDALGGEEIHIVEPSAMPFEGTATTAAVVQFRLGQAPEAIGFRSVPSLANLAPLERSASPVARQRLLETGRWSVFTKTRVHVPEGHVELGELVRVHRGTVTGANRTWVTTAASDLPAPVLYPSITRARELFAAGDTLQSTMNLKNVIDIPADLDSLDPIDREVIDKFLRAAKKSAVHQGYVAKNRRAWWSVGLKAPAPILATYMARRPPAFVRNEAEARHINIAHGLYPRQEMTDTELRVLAAALSTSVTLGQGRTYAGGLTKFEPREMERLTLPDLATLMDDASTTASRLGSTAP